MSALRCTIPNQSQGSIYTSKAKEAVDKDDVDMVCNKNAQSAEGGGGEMTEDW